MPISIEHLDYEYHLSQQIYFGNLKGDEKEENYWHHVAQDSHTLEVIGGLNQLRMEAVMVGQLLPQESAHFHLVYGLGRRSHMIWQGLRRLYGIIPPNREEPITYDNVHDVELDLNSIYINLRGAMDNLAWSLKEIVANEKVSAIHEAGIGLFNQKFVDALELPELSTKLNLYLKWHNEFKTRRDPAAHRIPLTVPPAIHDSSHSEEYQKLRTRWNELNEAFISKGGVDAGILKEKEEVFEKLQQVGIFLPRFIHLPSEGTMPIYPTIPQDTGNVVKIAFDILNFIQANLLASIKD